MNVRKQNAWIIVRFTYTSGACVKYTGKWRHKYSCHSDMFLFVFTNRMWFSVVYSFIDNDTRHRSGQNVVDSRGAAEWVRNK